MSFKITIKNDHVLINVIYEKKIYFFIGLEHTKKLGNERGKATSIVSLYFVVFLQGKDFLLARDIEAANTSFSYELWVPYKLRQQLWQHWIQSQQLWQHWNFLWVLLCKESSISKDTKLAALIFQSRQHYFLFKVNNKCNCFTMVQQIC